MKHRLLVVDDERAILMAVHGLDDLDPGSGTKRLALGNGLGLSV